MYDDDEEENDLIMNEEQWRFIAASANKVQFTNQLTSSEQDVLKNMFETLGNKPFLLHHSQGFDYSIRNRRIRIFKNC